MKITIDIPDELPGRDLLRHQLRQLGPEGQGAGRERPVQVVAELVGRLRVAIGKRQVPERRVLAERASRDVARQHQLERGDELHRVVVRDEVKVCGRASGIG